jgi:hypothetical protein
MSVTAPEKPKVDGTTKGEDAEEGKLFDVPRVAVAIDESDPSVLKIAFAGGVEFERGDGKQVEWYNGLAAGEYRDLKVTVFCAGSKNTHRRDSEGDVDAVVQTKSLIVTDVKVTK